MNSSHITIDMIRRRAADLGLECLDESYPGNFYTQMEFVCIKEGHSLKQSWNQLKVTTRKGCYECHNTKSRTDAPKYNIEYIQNIARERGGRCLSMEYNSRKSLTWKCREGHVFQNNFYNILYQGSWCSKCRCRNYYEDMTNDILQKLFNLPFISTRSVLSSMLEIDCYNNDLKLAVEYNGKQHYKHVTYFHKTEEEFIRQQQRDQMKREECIKLGIHLIEVPYTYITYTKIKDYLIDSLLATKYCDMLNIEQDWTVYFNPISFADKELDKLRKKAESNGGKLVSTIYGGSYEKLEFKCHIDDHPSWFAQPNNINAGQWCPYCNPLRPKEADYYKKIIESLGLEFISDYKESYTDSKGRRQCRHYIEFICKKGGHHKVLNNNLKKQIRDEEYICNTH